jgi:hypothetical protein
VKGYDGVWPGPGLSNADAGRLQAVFGPQLEQLEARGVRLEAIEFGNEINWAPFNGDFPVPGRGRVLELEALRSDPLGQRLAAGYRAYVTSAFALKSMRDGSRLNQATPLISAGLADPTRTEVRARRSTGSASTRP